MTMKYKPVPISKLVAETPELDHGDTTENPTPTPNDSITRVNAQDVTAPAKTAAHDTPATTGSSISPIVPTRLIACSMDRAPSILHSTRRGMSNHCESSLLETRC